MKYGIGSALCLSDEKCQSRREIYGHKLLCLGDFYVGVKLGLEEKHTARFAALSDGVSPQRQAVWAQASSVLTAQANPQENLRPERANEMLIAHFPHPLGHPRSFPRWPLHRPGRHPPLGDAPHTPRL